MGITHVVLFQFKETTAAEDIKAAGERFLAMKDKCLHPTTQKPYIESASGGIDNSPEKISEGITHGFVMEFANREDRDYYLDTDPVHQDFKKSLAGLITRAQVIDYESGVFH